MHANPVCAALNSRTEPFQAKGKGCKTRNWMHFLHDIITFRNLIFQVHSRAKGCQPTAVSRDRIDAALMIAITKSAGCHFQLSGAARLGHPPKK